VLLFFHKREHEGRSLHLHDWISWRKNSPGRTDSDKPDSDMPDYDT
jgi:hypothetical protein